MGTRRIVDRLGRADTAGREAGTLSRKRHRLIIPLLSLALLIAQLGAEAHAYAHLKPDQHGIPSVIQSCGLCVSHAPLLSIIGNSQSIRLPRQPEADRSSPINITSVAFRLACPIFRSRAPPQVL